MRKLEFDVVEFENVDLYEQLRSKLATALTNTDTPEQLVDDLETMCLQAAAIAFTRGLTGPGEVVFYVVGEVASMVLVHSAQHSIAQTLGTRCLRWRLLEERARRAEKSKST